MNIDGIKLNGHIAYKSINVLIWNLVMCENRERNCGAAVKSDTGVIQVVTSHTSNLITRSFNVIRLNKSAIRRGVYEYEY